MDKKTFDKGLEVRTAVLGKSYVENATKNVDDFNRPFQELLTEYCWGAERSEAIHLAASRKKEWIASLRSQ